MAGTIIVVCLLIGIIWNIKDSGQKEKSKTKACLLLNLSITDVNYKGDKASQFER